MSRGLTYEEAAAELGIGIETVKEHLKRARDRLGRAKHEPGDRQGNQVGTDLVIERHCPGCNGKISREGQALRNMPQGRDRRRRQPDRARRAIAGSPPPPPAARTTGQNRAYHGKCGTLARLRGVPPRGQEGRSSRPRRCSVREIATSKAMNEDEMSDVLDTLDDAIAQAETEA
jgi:hypothetical protein